MIDWQDKKKRKAFQEALQKVYPDYTDLAMFVDYELGESLATIAPDEGLSRVTYKLLNWFESRQRLDEVYQAFKGENPKHPVIETLERRSFVSQASHLTQRDWDTLFGQFLSDDLADLQRAFQQGFRDAFGIAFRQVQPQHPSITEVAQIRELLEIYDADAKGPVLAVRFVESAIAELQRSSDGSNRDLTALEQWRDRISQQHTVSRKLAEPSKTTACQAYLLVALEEIGSDVNVYPELHITGAESPIRFGATPKTCSIHHVADQISDWIKQAEDTEEIRQCEEEEVTLELFLPCKHLEDDVAMTWNVKDKRGSDVLLGIHRRLLVRSADRIRDRKIQKALMQKWQLLKDCVSKGNGCSRFHLQEDCLEQKGALSALLRDMNATGLKLIGKLPADPGKRIDLLNDIIDAAIPIALWSSESAEADAISLKTEFDSLLEQCHVVNFADLARQWRIRRMVSASAKQIRLLCDQPDRLPRLPDPSQEEDLLVAS